MGKPPADIKAFYERFNVQAPKADGEEDEEEPKEKKKKKKGDKKKKKGKKKKDDGDEKQEVIKIGPTEVITKFEEENQEFLDQWQNRDETDNYK